MTPADEANTIRRPGRPPSPGSDIAFPEAKMHLVRPNSPVLGTVVGNEICTRSRKAASFIRHLEIDVSGTPLEGAFLAGQSFGVVPPGQDARGRPHQVRLYSIASPTAGEDGQGQILSTTVKRTIDEHWETNALFLGVASNYLCDLRPGDAVSVTGPNGKRFLLPSEAGEHEYLFVATGTGVAPFRGMAMELAARAPKAPATLVMGAPYRTDLLYDDLFAKMQDDHGAFTYLTAISREMFAGESRMYVQDRLLAEHDRLLDGLSTGRTLVYICGIAGMELGVLQALAKILPSDALRQYLMCDDGALANIDTWDRRMIHKQIKPTRKVFIEVY
jgi:ferredoxin--NADP+ reductase